MRFHRIALALPGNTKKSRSVLRLFDVSSWPSRVRSCPLKHGDSLSIFFSWLLGWDGGRLKSIVSWGSRAGFQQLPWGYLSKIGSHVSKSRKWGFSPNKFGSCKKNAGLGLDYPVVARASVFQKYFPVKWGAKELLRLSQHSDCWRYSNASSKEQNVHLPAFAFDRVHYVLNM